MSIYGGYFGAGLGIMLLAVLGLLFSDPLGRLNALKQALALVINVVAAAFFSFSGHVLWTVAAVMAPGQPARRRPRRQARGAHQAGRCCAPSWSAYGTVLALWYLLR